MSAYLVKPAYGLVQYFRVNKMNWSYPWGETETLLLIEIENMPGHVAIARTASRGKGGEGKVYFGYDKDSFRRLRINEV